MRTSAKVVFALLGVVAVSLASMPIGTYNQIREARDFVHGAVSVDSVREQYGKFSHQISDPKQLAEWKKRYPLDIRDGDTLLIRNREGFPYWIIAIVSPDSSSIRDRYVGFYR